MSLTGTTPEDFLGEMVGGYTLARVLGTGSTGIVFLGEHPEHLTENVAIKICLPPIYLSAEERAIFQARFLREAEVVQRLYHPHIVPVLQRGVEGGILYTIFRYMQGGTLAEEIAQHPHGMELDAVIHITTQLAAALDTAHDASVVHRDIKPTNIFFDRPEIFAQQEQFSRYDDAYLGDFGTVYLIDQARVTLTAQGQVLGTPGYMSPEQANGALVTPATDIYSLGIVVYEMITGQLPFEAASTLQLLLQIVEMPPPLPRHLRHDLPEAAEAAVLQAIAKAPALRFATAGEFATALTHSITAPAPSDEPQDDPLLATAPSTDTGEATTLSQSTGGLSSATNTGALPAPLFPRTGPLPAPPLMSFADGKPQPIPRPEPETSKTPSPLLAYLSRENILIFVGAILVTVIGVLVLLGHRAGSISSTGSARAAMTATPTTSATPAATSATTPSPSPSQTASATTIASAPGATPPPKPGSSAPPAPGQPPATATAVPQPTLLYDFEGGQVWQKLGSQITNIVTSTDYAFDGAHSNEIKVAGLTTKTYPEAYGTQPTTIPTNAILSEEVYLPAGIGNIKAQAFVILQNNVSFYHNDYVELAAGSWTTLRYTLPSETFNQTAINIGVQFFATSGTINGSLYIDHVEFVPN